MKSIGRKIIRLESVGSTNNYTANLLNGKNIEHGTVIMADEQFAGRGQRSAQWLSNAGENLTCSLFLSHVKLSVDNQFKLTQFISLALCQFLDSKNISAKIKWPNDIYVNDEKIAGILIENQIGLGEIKNSIVGIGLNVNQTKFGGLKATSLNLILNKRLILEEVLFEIISTINDLVENRWGQIESINELYYDKLLGYEEERIYRDKDGNLITGKILGTNQRGLLRLLINGDEKEFDLKEIEFIIGNGS